MSKNLKDHRDIGRDQDLFVVSSLVGGGLPLFTPKGFVMRQAIEQLIRVLQAPYGYKEVWTPHMAKEDLYKKSGHFEKFPEKFTVTSTVGDKFILKPVNCPHHFEIYSSKPRSYKDLPVSYTEFSTTYRDEQSGELNGLLRVRSISIDDCHIMCREDQVEEEALKVYKTISGFYEKFNFGIKVRISLRDPKDKQKYLGGDKDWDEAEKIIKRIAKHVKEEQFEAKGEAAIYGPKIDFMISDNLGREWQLGTIQVDFTMPHRFGMTYVDESGKKKQPVVIHRAIAGSLERFIGILIEQYQGVFPLWLSPVQTTVLAVSEKNNVLAKKIYDQLVKKNIRAELNVDNKTLGNKIREASLQKIPYMIIIGDKESEKMISVRTREGKDLGQIDLYKFIASLQEKIEKFQ